MYITNSLANTLLAFLFNGGSYTPPATYYAGLLVSDPEISVVEVTDGSYARQTMSLSTASDQSVYNSTAIEFGPFASDVGQVYYVGVFDADSGGNLLYYTPLDRKDTANRTVILYTGSRLNFDVGELIFRM